MEVSVSHSNIKNRSYDKKSSIVREVRSDDTYLGGIYVKVIEFICRHVVLSIELNTFLSVAPVMNMGISYRLLKC